MENEEFLLKLEVETEAEIQTHPIVVIDRILEALHGTSTLRKSAESLSRLRRLFDQAALAVVNARSSQLKPIEELFDQTMDAQGQRFVAICLLRLLGTAPECFEVEGLSRSAFDLFDRTLAGDLYKVAKVETKMQTYEKISVL